MKDFILPPYEFAGSLLSPRTHAQARLEVGSKKRNFALKIHEGVIYFKEPARAPIFAIPEIFDDALAKDSIGLISRWQSEVTAGNYGAFIAKRDFFARLPVRGNFLLLVRADGTGWMREHFDAGWFDLPAWEKPHTFDLWNDKVLDAQIGAVLPLVKASLLQRTVEPPIRQNEMPRWVGGSIEEFLALVSAAARLFLNAEEVKEIPALKLKSHSAFAKGDVESPWLKTACLNPRFDVVWKILEREFHYVGVNWSEGGEKNEIYPRPRVERTFQEGLATWGENWRGNWAPQRASLTLQIPNLVDRNGDEKTESTQLLKKWLQDRVDAAQLEALLP